jgi:hypothetical protein
MKSKENQKLWTCRWCVLLTLLLVLPPGVHAQTDQKLSIRLQQQDLVHALRQLQDTSWIIFAFDETRLQQFTTPARHFKNESLHTILTTLLKETGYSFKAINGSIVIIPIKNNRTPSKNKTKQSTR